MQQECFAYCIAAMALYDFGMDEFHAWLSYQNRSQVARDIGVNYSTVWRWHKGGIPRRQEIEKMIDYYRELSWEDFHAKIQK
jgi:hypothetical protein